ncbi:hypothetical protein LARV_03823 [Longilinea arvoryzae]|uniref:Uncharacterized protein n=1 Tax=Longilinea arvoryzae TaxID=360412 RepID=A0A0K8MZG0_9CHLR|nr:hypothetical protein LARV_03823 [Longilinea arvoryzae]
MNCPYRVTLHLPQFSSLPLPLKLPIMNLTFANFILVRNTFLILPSR